MIRIGHPHASRQNFKDFAVSQWIRRLRDVPDKLLRSKMRILSGLHHEYGIPERIDPTGDPPTCVSFGF